MILHKTTQICSEIPKVNFNLPAPLHRHIVKLSAWPCDPSEVQVEIPPPVFQQYVFMREKLSSSLA